MASDSITEVPSSPVSDEEGEEFMEELKHAISCSPFIFKVPESVSRANPYAFLPNLIFLGLIHNAKNKMEFYKLYMANKVRGELHLPEFDHLCSQISTLKLKIQACYDTHFDIDAENLARIMVVDALFLLRLLLNISRQMESFISIEVPLPNFDAEMNLLHIDHKMLVKDVVKLENQIPLVVFQAILPCRLNGNWSVLVYHFSQSLSPFAFDFIQPIHEISDFCEILDESHHLLHVMYLSILFFPGITYWRFHRVKARRLRLFLNLFAHKKWFRRLESVLDFIQNATELRDLIQKLIEPITIRMMPKKQITTISSPVIPSASHLHKLSVHFQSTHLGIGGTSFTKPKRGRSFHNGYYIPTWNRSPPKLTLPIINVNDFTETLFENLLAFEAMANMNPPVYSLYTHLMKALIGSTKDVQILKENGIIKNHLVSDEQVVSLFQRLGSSISNLKSPPTFENFLPTPILRRVNAFEEVYDRMIEEINQYYDSCWSVQATRLSNMLLSYVCKMGAVLLILFQIYKLAMEMLGSVIEHFEPNYDHEPAT